VRKSRLEYPMGPPALTVIGMQRERPETAIRIMKILFIVPPPNRTNGLMEIVVIFTAAGLEG